MYERLPAWGWRPPESLPPPIQRALEDRLRPKTFSPGALAHGEWTIVTVPAAAFIVAIGERGSGAWVLRRRAAPVRRAEAVLNAERSSLLLEDVPRRTGTTRVEVPFQGNMVIPLDRWKRALNERLAAGNALDGLIQEKVHRAARRYPPDLWLAVVGFLMAGGRAALDLACSTPALAGLLALRAGNRPLPRSVDWLRRALGRRQAWIAGKLGLPQRQATVRLLRKVTLDCLPARYRPWLVAVLREPVAATMLAHVPRITPSVLALCHRQAALPWITTSLLAEAALAGHVGARSASAAIAALIGARERGWRTPSSIRSLAQLSRAANSAEQLLHAAGGASAGSRLLAPVPGIPGIIEPVETLEELYHEAREMQHCAFQQYARDAVHGSVAFYRVLKPGRATLGLVRVQRGWGLLDLRERGDAEPGRTVRDTVARWLEENGVEGGLERAEIALELGPAGNIMDEVPF